MPYFVELFLNLLELDRIQVTSPPSPNTSLLHVEPAVLVLSGSVRALYPGGAVNFENIKSPQWTPNNDKNQLYT